MEKRKESYVIMGNPIVLHRPRFGKGRVWDNQRAVKEKLRMDLIEQHKGDRFSGHLKVTFYFFMPIPMNTPIWQKKKMLYTYHRKRPDLSNMIKFYEDIANKIIFDDDSLISQEVCHKLYGHIPRVVMVVETMDKDELRDKLDTEMLEDHFKVLMCQRKKSVKQVILDQEVVHGKAKDKNK